MCSKIKNTFMVKKVKEKTKIFVITFFTKRNYEYLLKQYITVIINILVVLNLLVIYNNKLKEPKKSGNLKEITIKKGGVSSIKR